MTKRKPPEDHLPDGHPPKYKEDFNEITYRYCLLGKTNDEIAKLLEIGNSTFCRWLKLYPKFWQAVYDGREFADAQVVASLFRRSIGFTDKTGTYHPPDPRSIQFWLKNRQRKQWREKHEIEIDMTVRPSIIKRRDGSTEELGFIDRDTVEAEVVKQVELVVEDIIKGEDSYNDEGEDI